MSDENAIRQQRRRTNKLIADHEAERLRPFFDPKVTVIAGDGSVILGLEDLIGRFESFFRDPTFIAFDRKAETVILDKQGARASERGDWVASWHGPSGTMTSGGQYQAVWKKAQNQWVLESEHFIALT
ncbi:MAG: nuclear transport factor 2 family protein [Alphaproteobacteria bacterium]|nr:nuclear transport factor 2 family protein [Alphaproteobacteria bacterium]